MRKRLAAVSTMVFVFSFFMVIFYGCAKEKAERVQKGKKKIALVKGDSIRKRGTVNLEVESTEETRRDIATLTGDYDGQILRESVDVGGDGRRSLRYRIKVPADKFSVFMEKVSVMGRLIDMNVEADDVSKELQRSSDRADLLRRRLYSASKAGNGTLADSLREKLARVERRKSNLQKKILYSYINIRVQESVRLSHAFSMGYYYGKAGFIWMVKALVVLFFAAIPLVIVYLFLKLIRALLLPLWKGLLVSIERIGTRKGKE